MRQVLHLLILDRDRRAALAARYDSRWLLPVIACRETTRAALLVARWCAQRGIGSDVAGQWLGRAGRDATDWLVAIPARSSNRNPDSTFEWISLDALSSGASVLDYQTWALARSVRGRALPFVDGPFGNVDWPEPVRAWIGESVGSPPCAWTPYRVSAHEIVLGVETASGRVYCKGLTADRACEAALTQTLAALAPDSFARTLALDRRNDGSTWWLTAECAGRPERTHLAGPALARIQRMTAMAADRLALQRLDVEMAAAWAVALLQDSAMGAAIRRACETTVRAGRPHAWIPMDLDPANVLVDDDGAVRFIDVDDSFFGPAPLAMAILARRSGGGGLYRAYEQSWSPSLRAVDWPAFEIAATVVQFWLGWKRLERNIARGEVFVDRDLVSARMRARLVRAIGISPFQPRPDDREA
ncbi:MAG TPA: hypothetical protein VL225_10550 [Vicinamibacterales bacterium]|nr:hypothetical protein [Vicinamibacterales bacterium]